VFPREILRPDAIGTQNDILGGGGTQRDILGGGGTQRDILGGGGTQRDILGGAGTEKTYRGTSAVTVTPVTSRLSTRREWCKSEAATLSS